MITLDGTNGITTPDVEVDSIGTSTSTAVTVRTNGAERLRVDSAGNVGIGTTNAGGFSRTIRLNTASGTAGLLLCDADTDRAGFYIDAGTTGPAYLFTNNSKPLVFSAAGAERARIDASGNLLVGTTSALGTGKVGILHNTASDNALVIRTSSTTFNSGSVLFQNSSGGNAGFIQILSANSVAYNTSSDYRLKEDVQPMVGSVDRLMALKPVNFAWKADGSRVDGFLAHEAQEVVPECVTGEKDAVDDEGNPQYQGIDQSKIVPLLVAALQEALTKIEALEARVAALETNA
jgi:hypothetical protein